MKLPCITIDQPWASLIMANLKNIEARTHKRFVSLVGETVGIHASNTVDLRAEHKIHQSSGNWLNLTKKNDVLRILKQINDLPKQCLLGTVFFNTLGILNVVHESRVLFAPGNNENLIGYGMQDPKPFDKAISMPGKQGIWYWDSEAEKEEATP